MENQYSVEPIGEPPFPSWAWKHNGLHGYWDAPVPHPAYVEGTWSWDEPSLSWIKIG